MCVTYVTLSLHFTNVFIFYVFHTIHLSAYNEHFLHYSLQVVNVAQGIARAVIDKDVTNTTIECVG